MQNIANEAPRLDEDSLYDEVIEKRIIDGLAEFAAGAGHELNNPLAIISGTVQNLLKKETNPSTRRSLALIDAQAKRAYEMIADVRGFARPPMPENAAVSVSCVWNEWVLREERRVLNSNKSVSRRFSVEDKEELTIETDVAMLNCALDAIGKNACEAVADGGSLLFFCDRRLGDENGSCGVWELGVEDDGRGISDEERELVFSPFFSGRQAGRGLGFGLSKAWRYAETLGFRLVCEKSKSFSQGCRWFVEIPIG